MLLTKVTDFVGKSPRGGPVAADSIGTFLIAEGVRQPGVSDHQFRAIEAHTGRTAWSLPGRYRRFFPGTVAGDGIVYFHGLVDGIDSGPDDARGVMHTVDATSGRGSLDLQGSCLAKRALHDRAPEHVAGHVT